MKKAVFLSSFLNFLLKIGIIVACTLGVSSHAYAGSPYEGEKLYSKYCSSCHGSSAKNRAPGVSNLYRGDGMRRSDIEIVRRIERGNRGCPSYRGIIRENELLDLVAYLRTLY